MDKNKQTKVLKESEWAMDDDARESIKSKNSINQKQKCRVKLKNNKKKRGNGNNVHVQQKESTLTENERITNKQRTVGSPTICLADNAVSTAPKNLRSLKTQLVLGGKRFIVIVIMMLLMVYLRK